MIKERSLASVTSCGPVVSKSVGISKDESPLIEIRSDDSVARYVFRVMLHVALYAAHLKVYGVVFRPRIVGFFLNIDFGAVMLTPHSN